MASLPALSEAEQGRLLLEKKLACDILLEEYNLSSCAPPLEDADDADSAAGGVCPPIWDGILCWESAKAGTLILKPCPVYIVGFHPERYASKECLSSGTWYKKNDNPSWTNYSQCFSGEATVVVSVEKDNDHFIVPYLPSLKIISEAGYSISLVSLLVAFTILISIKKLRCPRNVLHMHLFASFIMRAFMFLLKDSLFVQGLATTTDILTKDDGEYFHSEYQTNWLCRLIVSLWQYFIMANYTWILMEGLYLHNLIFLALFTDSSSITLYVILGWGLPFMFVLPWAICRALLENEFCWTINNNRIVFFLIRGPTTATIVVNFILFINIIRVLLRKLQSSVCEETKTYRRWAKSTLVLVPLFGVHYMIFLAPQYSTNRMVELVWLFCDQLFTSFNGFFVALLYCFLNGEVRIELSKKWNHFSFLEMLERWRLHGQNSIFSSSRFLGNNGRHRPSCYSSTSNTVDTVVHSGNRDKKRHLPVLKGSSRGIHVTVDKRKNPSSEKVESDSTNEDSEVINGLAKLEKNKRWSSSDYDIENNSVELRRITSSNNNIAHV